MIRKKLLLIAALVAVVVQGASACDTCTELEINEVKRDSAFNQLEILRDVNKTDTKRFARLFKDYKYFAQRVRFLNNKVKGANHGK